MRGIAGKQTRGLPTAARLHVADNTGAKVVQIVNILKLGGTMRRYPAGGVGDLAKVSVKKGTPDTRRQMFNAVIIRQKRPFRRVDGTWVQFEDNACVITNEKGDVQGSDIKGPVSREAAERWPRIAANAKQIVRGENMVKSMKPGKQRKAHFNAAMHEKRKRLSARLQLEKPDARFDGVRTVTVRVGDTVKVVRGDLAYGGKRHGGTRNAEALTGSVIRVDSNSGRLYIEGAKASKSDNKEEAVPVSASNVVVVKLDETDKYRVQQLTGNRS